MDKFWASGLNKQNLILLARNIAKKNLENIVLSGVIINEEIVSAKLKWGKMHKICTYLTTGRKRQTAESFHILIWLFKMAAKKWCWCPMTLTQSFFCFITLKISNSKA